MVSVLKEMYSNMFVLESYGNRVHAAISLDPTIFPAEIEQEVIPIYDQTGHFLNKCVSSGASHRLGLIHKTSDVIAITPDSHILLRQRPESFPASPREHTVWVS